MRYERQRVPRGLARTAPSWTVRRTRMLLAPYEAAARLSGLPPPRQPRKTRTSMRDLLRRGFSDNGDQS